MTSLFCPLLVSKVHVTAMREACEAQCLNGPWSLGALLLLGCNYLPLKVLQLSHTAHQSNFLTFEAKSHTEVFRILPLS